MESMEPMDINWNRVVSRFMLDETYEGIEAPHWANLADPEARSTAVDDDAWFCRPDCKHPKTADDFLRHTPAPVLLHPVAAGRTRAAGKLRRYGGSLHGMTVVHCIN